MQFEKVGIMSDDELVCFCAKVSKGEIVRAIKAGHSTFKSLQKATGVCPENSNCKENNPNGKCCSTDIMVILRSITSDQKEVASCNCCK